MPSPIARRRGAPISRDNLWDGLEVEDGSEVENDMLRPW